MEREKDIERKLKREVERNDGICFKFLSSVSGVPDRLILLPGGRMFFVETKRRGEKPRPLQERQIKKIRDLGFEVYVLDDEKEIRDLVMEEGGDAL